VRPGVSRRVLRNLLAPWDGTGRPLCGVSGVRAPSVGSVSISPARGRQRTASAQSRKATKERWLASPMQRANQRQSWSMHATSAPGQCGSASSLSRLAQQQRAGGGGRRAAGRGERRTAHRAEAGPRRAARLGAQAEGFRGLLQVARLEGGPVGSRLKRETRAVSQDWLLLSV